jgi:hypothetical protein
MERSRVADAGANGYIAAMTKRTDQEIQDLTTKFTAHAGSLPAGHQNAIQQMFEGTLHQQNIDHDTPKKAKPDPKRTKRLSLAVQATAPAPTNDAEMFPVLAAPPAPKVKQGLLKGTDPLSVLENQWTEAEKKAKAKKK